MFKVKTTTCFGLRPSSGRILWIFRRNKYTPDNVDLQRLGGGGGGTRSRLQRMGVFGGRAWCVGILGFVSYHGVFRLGLRLVLEGRSLRLGIYVGFLLGGYSWMWCGAVGVISRTQMLVFTIFTFERYIPAVC
jgi:hypothetical protein